MKKWLRLQLLLAFAPLCFGAMAQVFIGKVMQNQNSSTVQTAAGQWIFEVYPHQILKVVYTPKGSFKNEQISNAVIVKPLLTKALVNSTPKEAIISWPNQVKISINEEKLTFVLNNQSTILLTKSFCTADNRGFAFSLGATEKIFGAGERSTPLNRRGYRFPLYNQPAYGYTLDADALNYSVPFLLSSNQYALFFDNPAKGYLDIGKTEPNTLEYGTISGQLCFYIIGGNNYENILANYHHLVGTQPLPPLWAMGNLMSRFGYTSQDQLMEITAKMEQDTIPVDAVILDLFWFGDSIKGTMGNLDWVNKKAWPNPKKMMGTLKSKGIQTVLITEPFVLKATPNYEPSKKYHAVDSSGNPFEITDFYFGRGGLIDIFRTDAQQWFWSKYKAQLNNGVAGWWGDLGEPERHPAAMLHSLKNLGFARKFGADEVHNIYGHYWDKMLFEKMQKAKPNVRLFNLNRSGYAGSPRYGVFPWSGDVSRSWDGLKAQLPLMQGMSLSGIPYIHADAGGFAGGSGDGDLYVRWMQFAAFTPIFRPHGTALGAVEPAVKNIPSEAALWPEPYKQLAKKAIQMRYQLLPYNYTLAYEQATQGKPLVSPMFFYNPVDSNCYNATDQYMWGSQMLIAPITEPNAINRKLYLPAGDWYQLYTNKKEQGGRWMMENVVAQNIPVFVKAGSFIPQVFISKNTKQYALNNLQVSYYASSLPSSYTLYQDDGQSSNAIASKAFELIVFKSSGLVNGKLQMVVSSNGGHYPGVKKNKTIVFTLHGLTAKPNQILINNKPTSIQWNAAAQLIQFSTIATQLPFNISISM